MRAFVILSFVAGCGSGGGAAASCGNGACESGETAANCCQDCGCGSGQTCQFGHCAATASCGDHQCNGDETQSSCCDDCGCPTGQACTAGACVATRKAFGEPCTTDTDCVTNLCVGYTGVSGRFCSEACTKSSTCAAESSTAEYWCVGGQNNVNYCDVSCTSSSDCKSIGSNWSCDNSTDIENLVHGLCGVFQNLAEGYPCLDNDQCAAGECNGNWCSGPCTDNAACGSYAQCVFTQDQSYRCFPNCTSNSDCIVYGAGVTCGSITTRDGTTAMVCSG